MNFDSTTNQSGWKMQNANDVQRGIDLVNEASMYRNKNAFTSALQHLEKAENFFVDDQYLNWRTYLYHEKAMTLHSLNDLEEALRFIEKAENGYLQLHDYRGLVILLMNKSHLLHDLEEVDGQLETLYYAEYIVENKKIDSLLVSIYTCIADHYKENEMFFKAAEYYEKALQEIDSEPEDEMLYWLQVNLAEVFLSFFVYDESERILKNLYTELVRNNEVNKLTKVMGLLTKIYKARGRKDLEKEMSDKMIAVNKHYINWN